MFARLLWLLQFLQRQKSYNDVLMIIKQRKGPSLQNLHAQYLK